MSTPDDPIITFSCLQITAPTNAGKAFIVEDGKPKKGDTEGKYKKADVSRTTISSIEQLAALAEQATPLTQWTGGWSAEHEAFVASPRGAHGRTNEMLPWQPGGGLMVLDCDPDESGWTPHSSIKALMGVCPAMATAYLVLASSSGSNVNFKGKEWRGLRGFHRYVPVTDASDIPRALDALHKRLVIAGHHYTKLSTNGRGLVRSPVDRAMKTPSQPIYHRAHLLDERLEQNRLVWIMQGADKVDHATGDWRLDTREAISELTQAEIAEYDARVRELITAREAKPDAVAIRAKHVAAYVKKAGVTVEKAEALLSAANKGDLPPDFTLVMNDGRALTVAELLADPMAYDRKYCRDPEEPDAGSNKAFLQLQQPQPILQSYLHGAGKVYRLHATQAAFEARREKSADEILEQFDVVAEDDTGSDKTKPRLIDGLTLTRAELLALPAPPPPMHRDYFRKGELTLLIGASGVGKSTALMRMALEMAKDGRRIVTVSAEDPSTDYARKLGALVMLDEVNDDGLLARITMFTSALQQLVNGNKQGLFWPNNSEFKALHAELRILAPDVVIFETASSLGTGEESNGILAALAKGFNLLARELDASVIVSHHVSKAAAMNADTSQHASRGGSSFTGDAREVLNLVKPVEPDAIAAVLANYRLPGKYVDRYDFDYTSLVKGRVLLVHHAKCAHGVQADPRAYLRVSIDDPFEPVYAGAMIELEPRPAAEAVEVAEAMRAEVEAVKDAPVKQAVKAWIVKQRQDGKVASIRQMGKCKKEVDGYGRDRMRAAAEKMLEAGELVEVEKPTGKQTVLELHFSENEAA